MSEKRNNDAGLDLVAASMITSLPKWLREDESALGWQYTKMLRHEAERHGQRGDPQLYIRIRHLVMAELMVRRAEDAYCAALIDPEMGEAKGQKSRLDQEKLCAALADGTGKAVERARRALVSYEQWIARSPDRSKLCLHERVENIMLALEQPCDAAALELLAAHDARLAAGDPGIAACGLLLRRGGAAGHLPQ